jgi:hypothetical protein
MEIIPTNSEFSQLAETSTAMVRAMAAKSREFPRKSETGTAPAKLFGIKAGSPGQPKKQGVSTMSIAKFHNAAVALVGAFIVASLFVSAAVPLAPIA